MGADNGPKPVGMLLYASAGEDWRLQYHFGGQRLMVRTLNLNRRWRDIHRDLLGVADSVRKPQYDSLEGFRAHGLLQQQQEK